MAIFGTVRQVTGAVATAPVALCEPSSSRMVLAISIDAGTGYVSTSQGAAAGVGFTITSSSPLVMDYETWGEIVRMAWYGSADTNARKFGVIDPAGQ